MLQAPGVGRWIQHLPQAVARDAKPWSHCFGKCCLPAGFWGHLQRERFDVFSDLQCWWDRDNSHGAHISCKGLASICAGVKCKICFPCLSADCSSSSLLCPEIFRNFIPPPACFSSPPPSNHLLQHGASWPCRKPLLQNLPPALVCSGRIYF